MSAEKLDFEKFLAEYRDFQQEHPSFGEIFILSSTGGLEFCSPADYCTEAEAQVLLDSWQNHGSAAVIGEDRYPIISWEELQFAARNVRGKGALIGCKTKSDRYVVIHLLPGAKDGPTTAAIKLNRWSWQII